MITVEGKSGIKATVLAHSVNAHTSKELLTFELEYPRIILAELNTHCMLPKNSMSSRAVPSKKMVEQVRTNPAMPVRFGKNQAGMSDTGVEHVGNGRELWKIASETMARVSEMFADLGYHKQIGNRIIEPFQMMKTVVSGTEWNNFFHLRHDKDADPTFEELARVMFEAKSASTPRKLFSGQWHVPYFKDGYWDETCEESLDVALAVSSSCSAQVSYRMLDPSLTKAADVWEKLTKGDKVHASPFQHQATPIDYDEFDQSFSCCWPDGITHMSRDGCLWSAQFKEWIMHRQLIDGHVVEG
jgi:hypothetical protein